MKISFRIPRKFWYGLAAIIFLVYYPIGMLIVHQINDDQSFDATPFEVEGGSKAVATAITLINREVKNSHYTPNDPFFYPGGALVRMPAFQRGVVTSVALFTIELRDQLGRSRGSSRTDPNLLKAAGLLNYSPDVWIWDFSVSWFPTASSEKQFSEGITLLAAYNNNIAKNEANYERRSDNLMQLLDRIALDLGSASAAIDSHIVSRSGFALLDSAELYYFNKGRLYGNYLLLKAVGQDFEQLITERQIQTVWGAMLDSLKEGAESNHFFVMNADPKKSIFANHLASQGFYLLRARTQMRELTNILQK